MVTKIPQASVIIPAYNEAENIRQTILAIRKNKDLEIVLVDNGSTDSTVAQAEALDINVIDMPVGTIAALRNRGVRESNGNVLIFLDADVSVTDEWHRHLSTTIENLNQSRLQVTGSRVLPPDIELFVNKYWYCQLANCSANYINSGHLITTRELFSKIGGFTESLETAEDYDFCLKARTAGASIVNDAQLKVIHRGYPTSLKGLVNRERWHGRQDVQSWKEFAKSRTAWIAGFHLFLLSIAVVASLAGALVAVPIYFFAMYLLSFLLTIAKFGVNTIQFMLIMPILFYFYLCGRSLAIVDRLLLRPK